MYFTAADYSDRYGEDELVQLTDRLGAGAVDAAVFARAVADADAEIDLYLSRRYTLPLPVVPPVLVQLAGDIVRYRLWPDATAKEVRLRYEDAVGTLKRLAAGFAQLDAPLVEKTQGGVSISAPIAVFDAAGMKGY
jgi:phage gp36-like protein